MNLYLAGGLFNSGDRLRNILIADMLRSAGHNVIVPQERALDFVDDKGTLDLSGIRRDCENQCRNLLNIVIASALTVPTLIVEPVLNSALQKQAGFASSHIAPIFGQAPNMKLALMLCSKAKTFLMFTFPAT